MIRIIGKVSHEILDNGEVNWDNQFRKMLRNFSLETPLSDALLKEAEALAKQLHDGDSTEGPARLCQLAVEWVSLNPQPISLESPD
ncbi:hypothetical protein [Paenibacillus sp. WLX2291]|uniref:hypothetical protein n=1 Tax=Paenibacillus sp. WLX2291 TaxID=3296934 RepID=UPI003983E2FA